MSICKACHFDPDAVVTAEHRIVLHRSSQSLNAVGTNVKNNRGYRGARNAWARLLKPFDIPKATAKRRIYITRYWAKRKRAYDYGNLVGGFKPLLDMIVKKEWLIDDSPKHVAEYYAQYKSATGLDFVTIVIEDYETDGNNT